MRIPWRSALALMAALAAGCDTARPGAGFTNGPSPAVLKSEEKPAIRDDLREPAPTGDKSLADEAATSTGGTSSNAGTAARGGGEPGKAKPAADNRNAPEPRGTPPRVESSGEAGAQGGTKPPGNTNVGNPRSPQF